MSLTILFNKVRSGSFNQNESNTILVELDAILSENHRFPGRISQFPIEDGSNISDHIKNDPISVTIRGFVTNSPVAILGTRFSQDDPVQTAFDSLKEIRKNRTLVRLVTLLEIYDDMGMSNLNIPVSANAGEVIRFTAEFTKVTKVASETVDIPLDQLPAIEQIQDQATSPVFRGTQTPLTASEEVIARISFVS